MKGWLLDVNILLGCAWKSHEDHSAVLPGHRFIADDLGAVSLPDLVSYKETTDAHLVTLAKRHGLTLATLDAGLITKSWAVGVAENPL